LELSMNNLKRIMVSCVALFLLVAASSGKASQNQNWEKLKNRYENPLNELSDAYKKNNKALFPLMHPLCLSARNQAFVRFAKNMGVSSKKAKKFLKTLAPKVRALQVKAFWNNKYLLGGNPVVAIATNSVESLLNTDLSVGNLFLYRDSRSEPCYIRKYNDSVYEENKSYPKQLDSKSFVESLDKPKPSKNKPSCKQINQEKICQLFAKPVEQCDVQVVTKGEDKKNQEIQLNSEDLEDPSATEGSEEPVLFENVVESSSNLNQLDQTNEFESLLDRYVKDSENIMFGDQEIFEIWLYKFYKKVSVINNFAAENRENGVRFLFDIAKTSFKKDPMTLQLFFDTEKK